MIFFSALDTKLFQDLVHLRGQLIAVSSIVACGIAIMVMALGAISSLQLSRDTYYERYRFADVFASAKRVPERIGLQIAEIEGVRAIETRLVNIVTLDIEGLREPANAVLISLPDGREPALNGVLLYAGRWPDPARPDEAVVSKAFVDAHGFEIGSRVKAIINGRLRDVEIVGVGDSPEYIYMLGPGGLLPDEKRFAAFWMSRKALEAAFDMDGAFNDVSLLLGPEANSENVIDAIDQLLEPFGAVGAIDREDQLSNAFISGELNQLQAIAAIIPPIFLIVSALLINAILMRLIATERQQVGLLKAFGYDQREIATHYIKMAIGMVALGILAGFAIGAALARLMTELYADSFRFPEMIFRLAPSAFLISACTAVLAAVTGAIGAARSAAGLTPSEAMNPAPPVSYGKGWLQRVIAKVRFDEPTRMILRHLTRWPARAMVTVIGLASSQALLVGTLFAFDSVDVMLEEMFYRTDAYDVAIHFVEPVNLSAVREIERLPGVLAVDAFRQVPVRIRHGQIDERAVLTALHPGGRQRRVLGADQKFFGVPEAGLALSTQLSGMVQAGVGARVTVEVLEGERPVVDLPVTGLVYETLGWPAFMDARALGALLGEGTIVSGVYVMIDPDLEAEFSEAVLDRPGISSVSMQRASIESFNDTVQENINIMMTIYAVIGGSIAAAVVYNAARISLTERGRELASLRVLGFSRAEVSYILIGELALLVAIAIPLGGWLGMGLAALVAGAMATDLFRVPLVVDPSTQGNAALIVLGSAVLAALFVRQRVNALDLIAVLKTRE